MPLLFGIYNILQVAIVAAGATAQARRARKSINTEYIGTDLSIEQRLAARKVLRVKAMLVMDGAHPVAARTLDIATSGICLSAGQSLKMGHQGQISFEMYFGGVSHIITVRVSVTQCVYSGDEFKVVFQFLDLGLGALTTISKYMR